MIRIDNNVKMPKGRRPNGSPTALESKWIAAFVTAYRRKHNCALSLGSFDNESRIQVFNGPTFTVAHTPRRCKELLKGLS